MYHLPGCSNVRVYLFDANVRNKGKQKANARNKKGM
nr:MAG TPA: hypothetical protein [Caudoviricetes sp.]